MNQRDVNLAIPDVQSSPDGRRISIDRVGIKSIRHPLQIRTADGDVQHTIATFNMTVRLPETQKGTHMSRFVEILEDNREPFSPERSGVLLKDMLARLNADQGRIEVSFPYFVRKAAPVSGIASLLDYDVTCTAEIAAGIERYVLKVVVPVTSLCPCSKDISEYGAHNQRSHVTLTVRTRTPMTIEELVRIAEDQASSELYGLLKRPDEKFVTERAYDNPKFVEDLVRDVAAFMNQDNRIEAYIVEGENFESIHNHSAYALIERDKTKP